MPMDWIAANAMQDQSLEAQLAQRDLAKKMQLALQVAGQAEHRRQFDTQTQEHGREFDLRQAELKATREENQRNRDLLEENRQSDNLRADVSQLIGAKPGTVYRTGGAVEKIQKGGAGDRLTQDKADPTAYVLDKQEAERAALKEEAEAKARKLAEEHTRELMKLEQDREARATREEDQRNKDRDQVRKIREQKFKDAQTRSQAEVDSIPVHLRPAVKARATQIIAEGSKWWDPLDADVNAAEAWIAAAREIKEKNKITTPPVSNSAGKGTGAGSGVKVTRIE